MPLTRNGSSSRKSTNTGASESVPTAIRLGQSTRYSPRNDCIPTVSIQRSGSLTSVRAKTKSDREGVEIRFYSVIDQSIEEIELALKGMLKPEFEEVQLGTAEIRAVFRSSKIGNIAGCIVRSGLIRRNTKARIIRQGGVVADNLTSEGLRREKDDVTEVREGFECGINLGSFNDIKEEDVIETFEMREKPRS